MPITQDHIDASTPMGVNLVDGGATIRVWAPSAKSVHIVGKLAGGEEWQPTDANRLVRSANGYWSGFLAGVKEGDEYRFYVHGRGTSGHKRDPYARELTRRPPYPGSNCVVRNPNAFPWHDQGWRAPPYNDLVIYQLHVGTWWGRDPEEEVATFLDVLKGLDYLADLGVNAVQMLPIGEFAAPRSLGYGGSDLFSPENDYTVETVSDAQLLMVNTYLARHGKAPVTRELISAPSNQLKILVDLFHLHGMAVIFDVVYNHAGSEIRGQDDGIWFFDRDRSANWNASLYFTDQDWTGPVFAFWKSEVRQFLIDNAAFFVKEYHVDGFRYDETSVIDRSSSWGWPFLQDCTSTVRHADRSVIQIAEYWNVSPWVVRRKEDGGAGFDATWSDGLRESVRKAIEEASRGRDAHVDLHSVAHNIARADFPSRWKRVEYVESHDHVYRDRDKRVARLGDGSNPRSWYARSRARVASGIVLTSPGIPMIFMGQEVLEDKQWSDNPSYFKDVLIYWDGLMGDRVMIDHLRFHRELIRFRRRHPALRGEGVHIISVDDLNRVLAVQRWVEGQGRDVVILVSLNESTLHDYQVGVPRAGDWIEGFNSDVYDNWVNPNVAGNGGRVRAFESGYHGMPASAKVVIPANAVLVFTSDPGDPD
ncbi:alpha amylase C-terminal domain-containing protein [Microvirga sp. VF16]|uniref:alpha-amylase family glycosyl hydrolase n=1 Tax=Microvirga sp. VF16 TaxID=2807101 RepID=UPI00193D0D29|nr:alpha-amylase family glycosyl hydrolase [Microvirga sp. VF16]QRM36051.1 alpha amylase C-terminal domain-containing protein [Microvirga sp. VF16]